MNGLPLYPQGRSPFWSRQSDSPLEVDALVDYLKQLVVENSDRSWTLGNPTGDSRVSGDQRGNDLGKKTRGGVDHHQTSSNIIKHHQTSSNIIKHHQTSSNSWNFHSIYRNLSEKDGGAARGRTGVALLVRLAAQLGGVVLAGDEQIQVQQNLSGLGEGEE